MGGSSVVTVLDLTSAVDWSSPDFADLGGFNDAGELSSLGLPLGLSEIAQLTHLDSSHTQHSRTRRSSLVYKLWGFLVSLSCEYTKQLMSISCAQTASPFSEHPYLGHHVWLAV